MLINILENKNLNFFSVSLGKNIPIIKKNYINLNLNLTIKMFRLLMKILFYLKKVFHYSLESTFLKQDIYPRYFGEKVGTINKF